MFKDTNSYGVVYIQFLCALGIFFGLDIPMVKNAITEETLSTRQFLI